MCFVIKKTCVPLHNASVFNQVKINPETKCLNSDEAIIQKLKKDLGYENLF